MRMKDLINTPLKEFSNSGCLLLEPARLESQAMDFDADTVPKRPSRHRAALLKVIFPKLNKPKCLIAYQPITNTLQVAYSFNLIFFLAFLL